jgi:hypothetical protein
VPAAGKVGTGGSCALAEFAAGHTRGAYLVGSIRSAAELAR